MENKDNFSHSATVFPVKNIQKSIEFYTKKLEFGMTFSWGDPTSYAVLKKGGVSIHISEKTDGFVQSNKHCALYIFVYNVDKIYQRCVNQKVLIVNVLEIRDYKMRDFDIMDPDGIRITFGKGE